METGIKTGKKPDMTRAKIEALIEDTYHVKPEYLWKKFPDYAVYRHPENRKWFALLMNPTWEELHLPGERTTEILELKVPEELRKEYEGKPGILPAYHMNKENWLRVLADGTVSKETVETLLKASFEATLKD